MKSIDSPEQQKYYQGEFGAEHAPVAADNRELAEASWVVENTLGHDAGRVKII